jgi:hypothetical protein
MEEAVGCIYFFGKLITFPPFEAAFDVSSLFRRKVGATVQRCPLSVMTVTDF